MNPCKKKLIQSILFGMQVVMDLSVLEIAIRRRQQALWRKIVKEFEVEQSLNVQVQNWIREGIVSEKAYAKSRRHRP